METKKTFTISVYTENNLGLMNRISAIFLKRHINLESITASQSEIENVKFLYSFGYEKSKIIRSTGITYESVSRVCKYAK